LEAFGAEMATVKTKLESQDSRITSLHGRVGEVQIQQSDQQAAIKVLGHEIGEAREDIGEVRRQIHELSDNFDNRMEKAQESFDRKFESLTNAVKWGTMAMIALIGILMPILLK
jgi:peptidoglycan hydrolase CwlO-like protein